MPINAITKEQLQDLIDRKTIQYNTVLANIDNLTAQLSLLRTRAEHIAEIIKEAKDLCDGDIS